jgi:D-arabinose 1-dehydrogenase-like Zn-dependent alcohol dehydrogenase
MQPATTLLRDLYPTYGAVKKTICGPRKWDSQTGVGGSVHRAVLAADLHQAHRITIIETTALFPAKLWFPHSRRP